MKVGEFMTRKLITVDVDTPIMKALQTMRDHNIKRLPVMKEGNFIGLVTKTTLAEASPSRASRLSVHELNYIISKMTVAEVMIHSPITVTPDLPIEEAIFLGRKHGVSGFPVVDANKKLVGVLSTSDVAKVVIKALGLAESKSARIVIDSPDNHLGIMSRILNVLDENKIPLLSFLTLPKGDKGHYSLILRVYKRDVSQAVKDFKSQGIVVVD